MGRRLGWYAETGLTVGSALVVGVLGVIGVVDASVVSAATLSILALLSIDVLASRRRSARAERATRSLADRLDRAELWSMDQALPVSTPGTDTDLGRARDIRLAGVTLSRTVRGHLAALEQCLTGGGTVQIIVIDPASAAAREAARRSGLPDTAGVFERRLGPTVDLLRHLATRPDSQGHLRLRLVPFVPSFGLTIVDPDTGHGRVAVEVYSHRPGGDEPVLNLSAARDPGWYRHFVGEFDRLWAAARPLDPGERFPEAARPPGARERFPAAELSTGGVKSELPAGGARPDKDHRWLC